MTTDIQQNVLAKTYLWFEKAFKNGKTSKNVSTQLGVHFEEVAEMIATLDSQDLETVSAILTAETTLKHLSKLLKEKGDVIISDRVEYLDALGDQLVTLVGNGFMSDLDIVSALAEINASNFSKFDEDGEPIFNEHLKVMKGPNYFKPDLTKFI